MIQILLSQTWHVEIIKLSGLTLTINREVNVLYVLYNIWATRTDCILILDRVELPAEAAWRYHYDALLQHRRHQAQPARTQAGALPGDGGLSAARSI